MGKKRSREVDAQGDTPMEEPTVEKRDASSDSDDDESSDEVSKDTRHILRAFFSSLTHHCCPGYEHCQC
jgi:hypothetical protein